MDMTLDERWESNMPECGLDFCEVCGDCLGCYAEIGCLVDNGEWDPDARHIWRNDLGEVKFV